MKSILNILSFVARFMVALVVLGSLVYSAFTSTPINELLNWEWWVLFFAFDIWMEIQWMKKDKNKNSQAE